jgi:hypothetical protein
MTTPAPIRSSQPIAHRVVNWDLDSPIDQNAAFAVVEKVAFGFTLDEIERDPAYPPKQLFLLWAMKLPALAQAFSRAREISAYALEDEAITLLRAQMKAPGDQLKLKATGQFTDFVRWSAEKRNPAVYGRSTAVSLVVPIQINTSLDLGDGRASPSAGTAEFPNIYELKAETIVEVPTPMEPETASHARTLGGPRPGRLGTGISHAKRIGEGSKGPQKRVLIPRTAETSETRALRLEAEKKAHEQVLARNRKSMQAKRRLRAQERRRADTGDPYKEGLA